MALFQIIGTFENPSVREILLYLLFGFFDLTFNSVSISFKFTEQQVFF